LLRIRAVSELSPKEEVLLRTTLEAVDAEQYQCTRCLAQFNGRPDKERLLEAALEKKLCDKESDKAVYRISDSFGQIHFKRCPGNYVRPGYLALVAAFDAMDRGIPYVEGAYSDQPEKIMQVFDFIARWKGERARAQAEANKKKHRVG